MSYILHPWQLLLVILAGWVNQHQQQIIDLPPAASSTSYWEKRGLAERVVNLLLV